MQFIDEAKIHVASGHGGGGCISFRREANVPKGGPDGGDGGRGGSVIAECVAGLNTLIDYRYQQHFRAKSGQPGMGKQRYGKAAQDVVLKLPVGTQIYLDDNETLIADLTEIGQRVTLCQGGAGGMGNMHFKTSVNRAPRKSTPGEPGEEFAVWLKLKLLSDAGLIGFPNAGKSTFLSAVSRAKPKIADYPFTTLKPQLGVVKIHDDSFVLADIPGLIKGASQGTGLGDRFLKHVERCGVLLHLVDATQDDVVGAYETIRGELAAYHETLPDKPEVIALSKQDIVDEEELKEKQAQLEEATGETVYIISAATQQGTDAVCSAMNEKIKEFRASQMPVDEHEEEYSPLEVNES